MQRFVEIAPMVLGEFKMLSIFFTIPLSYPLGKELGAATYSVASIHKLSPATISSGTHGTYCRIKAYIVAGVIFLGHLSHSGDLLIWVDVRRRPSCVVRRATCIEQ